MFRIDFIEMRLIRGCLKLIKSRYKNSAKKPAQQRQIICIVKNKTIKFIIIELINRYLMLNFVFYMKIYQPAYKICP